MEEEFIRGTEEDDFFIKFESGWYVTKHGCLMPPKKTIKASECPPPPLGIRMHLDGHTYNL